MKIVEALRQINPVMEKYEETFADGIDEGVLSLLIACLIATSGANAMQVAAVLIDAHKHINEMPGRVN